MSAHLAPDAVRGTCGGTATRCHFRKLHADEVCRAQESLSSSQSVVHRRLKEGGATSHPLLMLRMSVENCLRPSYDGSFGVWYRQRRVDDDVQESFLGVEANR
jgi:hypothetical protein